MLTHDVDCSHLEKHISNKLLMLCLHFLPNLTPLTITDQNAPFLCLAAIVWESEGSLFYVFFVTEWLPLSYEFHGSEMRGIRFLTILPVVSCSPLDHLYPYLSSYNKLKLPHLAYKPSHLPHGDMMGTHHTPNAVQCMQKHIEINQNKKYLKQN